MPKMRKTMPNIQTECNNKVKGTRYTTKVIKRTKGLNGIQHAAILMSQLANAFNAEYGEPDWDHVSMEFTFTNVDVHGSLFQTPHSA